MIVVGKAKRGGMKLRSSLSNRLCPLRPPGEPYGKENRLSLTLCPPGLPGRRSRAAQALVAPAGAKLPRTLTTCKSLGIGDKVFALTKAVRPHKKSIYVIAGQESFLPLQTYGKSTNSGRSQGKTLSPQNSPLRAAGAVSGRILGRRA